MIMKDQLLKRFFLFFFLIPFLLAPGVALATEDGVLRISADDLHTRLVSGQYIYIVDVRSYSEYRDSSTKIEDAVRIPLGKLSERLDRLPQGSDIILYCSEPDDYNAVQAAGLLIKEGFSKEVVKVLNGGFRAWQYYNYPTELK